ncbi:hypothetical protein GCM10009664_27090 [Kitasatospora gansuensis]
MINFKECRRRQNRGLPTTTGTPDILLVMDAGYVDASPGPPWVPQHPRRSPHPPARVPKPSRPGPGRPAGSKNRKPAPRHGVGKTVKREPTLQAHLATRG